MFKQGSHRDFDRFTDTFGFRRETQTIAVKRKRVLIVGCGYVGIRLARQFGQRGQPIWGTTRGRHHQLRRLGIEPISFDWNDVRTYANLPQADQIVIAVAHDRRSGVDRFASQVDGLRRLIRYLDQRAEVSGCDRADLAYVSTTGVYHQTGHVWVDETTPTRPGREGAKAHLMAETVLRATRGNAGWFILRLAGIYGPGRVPRLKDVLEGRPIASPAEGYLNLIHVEDAAAAIIAGFDRQQDREKLYVVADDQPVIRRTFYEEIARQAGAPTPTFAAVDGRRGAAMRSLSSKRVCNRRFKRDLLPRLAFPTFREGLADVIASHVHE